MFSIYVESIVKTQFHFFCLCSNGFKCAMKTGQTNFFSDCLIAHHLAWRDTFILRHFFQDWSPSLKVWVLSLTEFIKQHICPEHHLLQMQKITMKQTIRINPLKGNTDIKNCKRNNVSPSVERDARLLLFSNAKIIHIRNYSVYITE